MTAVRRLRFLKFNFLTVGALVRRILLHRTKFRKARSNRCGDIAIFVIFKMAASAILEKNRIFMVDPLYGANLRRLAIFHQNQSNGLVIWRFYGVFFSKWWPSAILDFCAHVDRR